MSGMSYLDLARFLRRKREEKELSKAQLARIAGVTGPAIGIFESGTKRPIERTLIALLRALEVSDAELEEVNMMSGYQLTPEMIASAALDKGWLDLGIKVTDDVSLLQLLDKHGVHGIAAFLGDRENEALTLAILETQQQRGASINRKILQRLIMMGHVIRLSFSKEVWMNIITTLEEKEQSK